MGRTKLPRRLVKLHINYNYLIKVVSTMSSKYHVSKKCWGNIKQYKQYFLCQKTKGGSFGNQRQSLQPEKESFDLEHSRNISLGGIIFHMKTHHGRQNNLSTISIFTFALRTKRSKRRWQCYVSKYLRTIILNIKCNITQLIVGSHHSIETTCLDL